MSQPRGDENPSLQPLDRATTTGLHVGPQLERIASIDVLRGVVILGIVTMNMWFFATVEAAFFNPFAGPWTDRANVTIWVVMQTAIGMKDLSIFSMLFGAGIIMMDAHSRARGQRSTGLHYRRMAALLPFGLIHAYAIWFGDILYHYALVGCVVYLCRNFRNRTLLILAAACYCVMLLIMYSGGWVVALLPEEAAAEIYQSFDPAQEQIDRFGEIYESSWWQQMRLRAPSALASQTANFAGYMFWVAGGMMLAGMALLRMGVFEGRCPTRWYVIMIIAALVIGIPMILYGHHRNFAVDWNPEYSMYQGRIYSEAAAPFTALGWISAIMLVCRSGRFGWLMERIAAIGRMSLSNYLLQSMICSLVFYGHGLGLVNKVDRLGMLGITAGIWLVQLIISPLWLRHFSFGPVEWLWRWLAYGRRPLMRRGIEVSASQRAASITAPVGARVPTPAPGVGIRRGKVLGPVQKALIFAGLVLGGHLAAMVAAIALGLVAPAIGPQYTFEVLSAVVVVVLSWVCLRRLDRQPLSAIGIGFDRRWIAHALAGLSAGAGTVFAVWGILHLGGWAEAETAAPLSEQLPLLLLAIVFCAAIAVHEELLCRGYLFQLLAGWNRPIAIMVTGLLFLGMHVGNTGLTHPLTVLNLVLAHLLYVALYLRTRSLWPVIAWHAAWNFVLAFVLGMPISGRETKVSILVTEVQTGLWSANAFGPEGGLVVTVVLTAACAGAWLFLKQQHPRPDLMEPE